MAPMLVSCQKDAPKFPTEIKPLVPFMEFGVCAEYKIVRVYPLEIEPTGKTFPLAECDKVYGLRPAHQIALKEWIDDSAEYYKEKCK